MKTRAMFCAAAVLALAAAGCGSDDKTTTTSAPAVTAATVATPTTAGNAATTTEATRSTPTSAGTTTGESTDTTDLTESTATMASSDSTPDDSASDSSTADTSEIENRYEKAKAALENGDFSTMLAALNLSGLSDTINENQVTILAPTDEAFTELSGDQMKDLITNPTKVDDVLKRHILDKVYSYDELAAASEVTTIGGDTLTVTVDGDVITIDGAVVSEPDSQQTSGESGQEIAVFPIDRVLLEEG